MACADPVAAQMAMAIAMSLPMSLPFFFTVLRYTSFQIDWVECWQGQGSARRKRFPLLNGAPI